MSILWHSRACPTTPTILDPSDVMPSPVQSCSFLVSPTHSQPLTTNWGSPSFFVDSCFLTWALRYPTPSIRPCAYNRDTPNFTLHLPTSPSNPRSTQPIFHVPSMTSCAYIQAIFNISCPTPTSSPCYCSRTNLLFDHNFYSCRSNTCSGQSQSEENSNACKFRKGPTILPLHLA